MFIGHFGPGYAVKSLAPQLSLGALFLAVEAPDIVWTTLVLLGVEHTEIDPALPSSPLRLVFVPFSHSFTAALAWSAVAFALGYLLLGGGARARRRGALFLGAAVGSHWLLDALVHRPDLPLWGDTARVGLGLWDRPAVAFALEAAIFLAGLAAYLRATMPRTAVVGRYGMGVFAGALLLLQASGTFGPPPPSVTLVAATSLVSYVALAAIAAWLEQQREPRPATVAGEGMTQSADARVGA